MARKGKALAVLALSALLSVGVASEQGWAAKKKIRIWTLGGVSYQDIHKQILPEFQKQFPNIELEIEYTSDILNKYLTALAAGDPPDIVTLSTRYIASYVEQGIVAPINYEAFGFKNEAEFEQAMLPGALGAINYKGKIYHMPTEVSIFGLFYNRDLLDERGVGSVPKTWEELAEVAQKFVEKDADGKFVLHGLGLNRGWIWPWWWMQAFMRQNGVDVLDSSGKPQFNTQQAIRAMQVYSDLFNRYRVADPNPFDNNVYNAGNMAFRAGVSYEVFDLIKNRPIFQPGTAPLPYLRGGKPSTISYSFGHFVNPKSRNLKEAWEVVAFFTGPKQAEKWFRTSALLIPWKGDWINRVVRDNPLFKPFLDSLAFAQAEFTHVKGNEIRSLALNREKAIVGGQMSVQQALSALQQEVTALLAQK